MTTKKIVLTTAGIAAAGVMAAAVLVDPCEPVVGNYAELDKDGIVKRVIVADNCFIESGEVGEPSAWVLTEYAVPEKAAAIGGKYDATVDEFISKEDVKKFGKTVRASDVVKAAPITSIATSTK